MATIRKFEDLEIWKKARDLSLKIFTITGSKLFYNDFKFRDQARSSAGSVMDNIAEGFERSSRLEFVQFLGHSKGSCGEIRSQIYRAIDQKYVEEEYGMNLITEYELLSREIAGFIKYLNNSIIKGQKFKNRIT